MKDRSDLQRLSTNLQSVFDGKQWRVLWQTYKLVEQWPQIAGKAVAANSQPAYIRNNILWINVSDSVWMHQIHAQKIQLLEKVQKFHEDLIIRDIRLLLQTQEAEEKKGEGALPAKKINTAEQKRFEQVISSLKDEKCRDALGRLWKVYHGKKV